LSTTRITNRARKRQVENTPLRDGEDGKKRDKTQGAGHAEPGAPLTPSALSFSSSGAFRLLSSQMK
jgi:hypothetical protein